MRVLDVVRNAYAPGDFWSKTAKRSCRRLLAFRPRLDWHLTVAQFLKEFEAVEEHHGYILQATRELVAESLTRLICRSRRMEELSGGEQSTMLEALSGKASVPGIRSELAKSLILKACYEIGRLRTQSRMLGCTVFELYFHVRTVDEIVTTELDTPLPNPPALATMPFPLTSEIRALFKTIPEYHLAVARRCGDDDYWNAVEVISRAYNTLDEGIRDLCTRAILSEPELQFVSKFKQMASFIL